MAILKDQQVYWDGYDLTTKLNAVTMEAGAESLDNTVLGNAYRSHVGGLYTVTAQVEGFYEAASGGFESALFSNIGVQDKPFTIANTSSEGAVAHFFKMLEGDYTPFKNAVGELQSFSAGGMANSPLIRGKLIGNKAGVSTTATGTAFQLGAVGATQKLYVALHVLAKSGTSPTLDLTIESDSANNFPSAATVATFSQKTAVGSDWKEVSGAITDTWYRINYTIGGTTPSFSFIVVAGIL